MGANAIKIPQQNTRTVICTVTGLVNLNGYTATLTVKKKPEDTTAVIDEKEGSISDLVITFALTPTETNVDPYEYVYFITIDDETNRYTVAEDICEIEYSVKRSS